MADTKKDIINQLRKDILLWEGFKPPVAKEDSIMGLGPIEEAFPNGVFPVGTLHEMLCPTPESCAATSGFVGGLLSKLMQLGGACLWISTSRRLFPQSLMTFNAEPDRVIFIDLKKENDVLWATEEALKCEGLAAVITELPDITFAQSRRLQLAVENSKVTGFILRTDTRKMGSTTCVARWQIAHLPGISTDGLPGVSFPRWQVDLLKVRNGNPGSWELQWIDGKFVPFAEEEAVIHQLPQRKAG